MTNLYSPHPHGDSINYNFPLVNAADVTRSCIYNGNIKSECKGSCVYKFDQEKGVTFEDQYICEEHRTALEVEEGRIKVNAGRNYPSTKPCLLQTGSIGYFTCTKKCAELSYLDKTIALSFCHKHLPCLCKVSGDCDAIKFPIVEHKNNKNCKFRRFSCDGGCYHLRKKKKESLMEVEEASNTATVTVMQDESSNKVKNIFS